MACSDGCRLGNRLIRNFDLGPGDEEQEDGPPDQTEAGHNIADLTSFMWRLVAPKREHRCIIPLTGFCEAEGEKGAMTRTWFGIHQQPIFAWAGLWKKQRRMGSRLFRTQDRLQRGGAAAP